MKVSTWFIGFFLLGSCLYFSSCKKDAFLTQGGDLRFSTDTLHFDTVFTSVGSVTKSFKIFNRSDRPVKINRINLAGGEQSFFRLNVDGVPTKDIQDIEVAVDDSIYVFAALTVDPNNDLTPFVIDEKVQIVLNENNYEVPLQAYGQNAHFINGAFIQTDTWINDKPYVIVNSAAVDTGAVLTIQKGVRVYMHANSTLFVAGTLRVFGTKEDSVIFQGDRLDRDYFGYEDYPGEWEGIHFLRTSENNYFSHAVIKNGGARDAMIYVEPPLNGINSLARPMVDFTKTKIYNSLGYGILTFNTWLRMDNSLVHSCGLQNLAILEGGEYEFMHCTFVTYSGLGINHTNQPVMVLQNFRDTSQTGFVSANLNARFFNSIIYGPLDSELVLPNKGNADYKARFDHCLFKRNSALPQSPDIGDINNIRNQDPLFVDRSLNDYHLAPASPARNVGFGFTNYPEDLEDVQRDFSTPPNMGCFEE